MYDSHWYRKMVEKTREMRHEERKAGEPPTDLADTGFNAYWWKFPHLNHNERARR